MSIPIVPISWGELFDKVAILQLKAENISSPEAQINIRRELSQLELIASTVPCNYKEIEPLIKELYKVNEEIWHIENSLREKEYQNNFDEKFIENARLVYKNNDKRAALKRRINIHLKSEIFEEKSYIKPTWTQLRSATS